MSNVLVNNLIVRSAPSTTSEEIAKCNTGQIINSGEELIQNEEGIWLRYTGQSGNKRYVMAYNKDNTPYVDVAPHIPGPRPPAVYPPPSSTGIPGIPKLSQFPDNRLKHCGDCFLCTCVKGGLTTLEQCMDCFNWGIVTGKLWHDCYVNCNKEELAKEISSKYDTTYHEDYVFQKSSRSHFWLTQNGKEIFNSYGLGRQ